MSRLFISEHLEADVKASNTVSFNVNIFALNKSFGGRHFKYFKTVSTSHTKQYLGFGGLLLNTPVIKLQTFGCFPTLNPSIGSWNAEMLDLCVLILLYSKLA